MKRLLSTLLTLLFIAIATGAYGDDTVLEQGDYKVLTYTLSNGEPVTFSEDSSRGSINFHKLYIFPEAINTVLNREESFPGNPQMDVNGNNYQGFVIRAAYSPISNITFYSSIGLTDTVENSGIDYTDRIGWEIDLGLAYKVFNNFSYEIHFGYMDTGELFNESKSYGDVESITILANKLTMSF